MNRLFAIRFCAVVVLFLILTLNLLPVLGREAVSITAQQPQEYFYFPYQGCILGTVRAVTVQKAKNSYNACTELTVDIEDVLRGDLRAGKREVLAFDQPILDIFPGRSKVEILGLRFVLAFHLYGLSNGRRSISNIYSPFAEQKFSAVDVANLKEKLQLPGFPSRECVLLKVTEVRTKATSHGVGVKAVLEEVLLGDANSAVGKIFKQGGARKTPVDIFLQPADSPEAESELKKIRTGMRCVLGFDRSWLEGNECKLWNITTPLPAQVFSNSDIQHLRVKLKNVVENNIKLKAILQKYLEERWTVERVRKFCQPERRIAQPYQNLMCRNSFVLSGELYPSLKGELGDVTWYCGVDNNVPDQYSVCVKRKTNSSGLSSPDLWVLGSGQPGFSSYTEDDFNNDLVAESLSSCARNYDSVHRETTKPDLTKYILGRTNEQVIKEGDGRVTAYSCVLSNGAKLVAELDQNLSIKSILVDGKPDKDWTQALAEAAENIDILNRIEESYRKEYGLKP